MPEWKSITQSPEMASIDVVFVHGLGGDGLRTWLSTTDDRPWPRWVAAANPSAAIWFVDYDASPMKLGQSMTVRDRTISLLHSLVVRGIGRRPLVMVGHSLGGLLVKMMVEHSANRRDQFGGALDNLVGVAFLATPHKGASIARLGTLITSGLLSDLVADLQRNDSHLLDIGDRYREIVDARRSAGRPIRHVAYFETKHLKIHGLPMGLIVDKDSANPSLAGCTPVPADGDHISICKRPTSDDDVVRGINGLVLSCLEDLQGSGDGVAGTALSPTAHESPRSAGNRLRREIQALVPGSQQPEPSDGQTATSGVLSWLSGTGPVPDVEDMLRWIRLATSDGAELPVNERRWRQLHATALAEDQASGISWDGMREPVTWVATPDPASIRPGLSSDAWSDTWSAHCHWLRDSLLADVAPLRVIIGAVDSGKSTFFHGVAQRQPHGDANTAYVYWDLSELREVRSSKSFWKELSAKLGVPPIDHRDPSSGLQEAMRVRLPGERMVVIFDHWDDVAFLGGIIDEGEWMALEGAIHDQREQTGNRPTLGALLVTRQPTTRSYIRACRRTLGQSVSRLSGLISARQACLQFPMLEEAVAERVLRTAGIDREDLARRLVLECGGWVGLLASAAVQLQVSEAWDEWARGSLQRDLRLMLEKSFLPAMAEEFGTDDPVSTWGRVLGALAQGAKPHEFSLPQAFNGVGLPPLFAGVLEQGEEQSCSPWSGRGFAGRGQAKECVDEAWVVPDLADGRGDPGVPGLSEEPDRQVA